MATESGEFKICGEHAPVPAASPLDAVSREGIIIKRVISTTQREASRTLPTTEMSRLGDEDYLTTNFRKDIDLTGQGTAETAIPTDGISIP